MRILEVIPIAKGLPFESLSYFSLRDVPIGTIVTVSIRKKIVDALVISSEDISASKGSIKASDFKLKKIIDVKGVSVLPDIFWSSVQKTARHFISSVGATAFSLLPTIFWQTYEKLENKNDEKTKIENKLQPEKLVLQAPLEERISFFKSSIRESLARKRNVIFCVPTIHDLYFWENALKKGIEDHVYSFHSELGKKEFLRRYNLLKNESRSALIIVTPIFLFLSFLIDNLGDIILEKEGSPAFKEMIRPYIDYRFFAEMASSELKTRLVYSDTILRIETLYRLEQKELSEMRPPVFKLPRQSEIILVDQKKDWLTSSQNNNLSDQSKADLGMKNKEFFALGRDIHELIKKNLAEKKHIFLFTLRKGLSGITTCQDCSTVLLCDHCSAPLVLYNTLEKNRIFICNKCKKKKDAEVKCSVCGSWNLKPLGIGIERVITELDRKYNKSKIFRIDKETAKNHKQAQKIIDDFYKTPGAILVGTEMAFYYLRKKISFGAIVSFDSLWSIPSFKINEKIIRLLVALDEITHEKIIIQSKNINEQLLIDFKERNFIQFYRSEIEVRKKLSYPPFSTLIKISYRGSREAVEKEKNNLTNLFKNYNPNIFMAFIPKIKKVYILQAILKLNNLNIDEGLRKLLANLSPAFSIQVDPEDPI